MRKIIETLSTLTLWAVWFLGSALAISEILASPVAYKKVIEHLWIVSWSPFIAVSVFAFMMVAVWLSKDDTEKKSIPSQHTIKWSPSDVLNAQSGKFVDLHFPDAGLDCDVKTRTPQTLEMIARESVN